MIKPPFDGNDLIPIRRCIVPVRPLPSSVFARLAAGAFYEALVPLTFYKIITLKLFRYAFPQKDSKIWLAE